MLKEKEIEQAINLLKNNEIVILPTDTIYGLSAITNDVNEEKINKLKKINFKKPLIVLISDFDDIKDIVDTDAFEAEKLNYIIPTTVIFKLKNSNDTIAARVIQRKDIKEIIKFVGPIFSTSVNIHGQKPLNDKKSLENFIGLENLFYDDELNGAPSRIYNSITGEYIR